MPPSERVVVTGNFEVFKGAIISCAQPPAYFHSLEWLEPLRGLLGKELELAELEVALSQVLATASNPKICEIPPALLARKVSKPV